MSTDEKDLLDNFRQMSPENRAHLLSLAHATRSAQKTTEKAMAKKPAKRRKTA
jgi:hypothetical protein